MVAINICSRKSVVYENIILHAEIRDNDHFLFPILEQNFASWSKTPFEVRNRRAFHIGPLYLEIVWSIRECSEPALARRSWWYLLRCSRFNYYGDDQQHVQQGSRPKPIFIVLPMIIPRPKIILYHPYHISHDKNPNEITIFGAGYLLSSV